ncbi:retrovirus-related pol polyprotein from transposon TNT 1-94 [Tanacetum coccineum]
MATISNVPQLVDKKGGYYSVDEEEVSNDEEMTQVKVLMALADDELFVGKNHARNALRRNNVYVLDMSSLTPNGVCFFANASESVNWLWHKRLSHLNFKNINKLAKQNKVLSLPSLVYSKDKPCSTCERGKHKKASFKTKENFSIRKCLHLFHMDFLRPVIPMSIDHDKYTLVIVDDYSRTNKETEFRNFKLESFYDEKGISQDFSFSYTTEQNGVAERKNKTLIKAARTIVNGSVLSKHFWIKAVRIACYTQNRSTINEEIKGPPDLVNTEGTQELNVQDELINCQPTEETSGNNTKTLLPHNEHSVPEVSQSQITLHASTSSYPVAQDRWSKDQHIKLVNIIGEPGECMLIRSMTTKLTAASASDYLFTDFLSETKPKKVPRALKHLGWVFRNKKDEVGTLFRNKARLVAQGLSQEEGIDYDETFAPTARMEAIRIFLAFATYMNFIVFQMDVKSAFLNEKLKEECYVKQTLRFESSEFPDYVCKLDKALYGLKQAPRACASVKTPMVPPNNLGPDLAGKLVNETLYRGMIRYLKGTPSLGLWYPKCSGFDLKEYSNSNYAGCSMDRKST